MLHYKGGSGDYLMELQHPDIGSLYGIFYGALGKVSQYVSSCHEK